LLTYAHVCSRILTFAGFPVDLSGPVKEVSDGSDDEEEEEEEEEEEMARALADFVAERPHEIGLRVGQVVVVLTYADVC
jgi:hypothetical protein